MAKIKLFRMYESYDDYETTRILTAAVSEDDWEEITESDLELLRRYLYRVHPDNVTIVEKIDNSVAEAMPKIRKIVELEKKAEVAAAAAKKQKAADRALKKLMKSEEKERELLASLQEKYA